MKREAGAIRRRTIEGRWEGDSEEGEGRGGTNGNVGAHHKMSDTKCCKGHQPPPTIPYSTLMNLICLCVVIILIIVCGYYLT